MVKKQDVQDQAKAERESKRWKDTVRQSAEKNFGGKKDRPSRRTLLDRISGLEEEVKHLEEKGKKDGEYIAKLTTEATEHKTSAYQTRAELGGKLRAAEGEIKRLRKRLRLFTSEALLRQKLAGEELSLWKSEALSINRRNTMLRAEAASAEEMPWQLEKAVDDAQDAINEGRDPRINISKIFEDHGGRIANDVTLFQFVAYCDMRGLRIEPHLVEKATEHVPNILRARGEGRGESGENIRERIETLKLRHTQDGWGAVMEPGVMMNIYGLVREAAKRR